MGERKSGSSLGKKLGGAALLLGITLCTLALIPFYSCPTCQGNGKTTVMKSMPQTCPWCDGRGKINFVREWSKMNPIP